MPTWEELGRALQALEAQGIPFAEGGWRFDDSEPPVVYGVYAADGTRDLMAGGKHAERVWEGTVDLFVRYAKGLPEMAMIENTLDALGAAWRLNSVQYENDTGFTHYEWVVNALM